MGGSFSYSDSEKRYHTLTYHNRQWFGGRVVKIPINAGFTCPNRDGKRGFGGCSYCSPSGSGEFGGNPGESLARQFSQGVARSEEKWPGAGRIVYFQANSNTYAPVETLRRWFDPAPALPGVVGLSIATRADCLEAPVLDYLAELAERTRLTVELGLQSAFDETGERINRCHSFMEFAAGVEALSRRGIRVTAHLIAGLPGESREMMVESARRVGALPITGIKLHMLYLLRGTPLGEAYKQAPFPLLTREEYVKITCDQLECLPPQVVVERLTGDGDGESLIAPLWTREKRVVLNEIDRELAVRESWQGRRWQECSPY